MPRQGLLFAWRYGWLGSSFARRSNFAAVHRLVLRLRFH
jgi:hypothetical protein